jgi:hypothetical protein
VSRMKASAMAPGRGGAGPASMLLPRRRSLLSNPEPARPESDDDSDDDSGDESESEGSDGRGPAGGSPTRGAGGGAWRQGGGSPGRSQSPDGRRGSLWGSGRGDEPGDKVIPAAAGERRYIRTGLDDAAAALAATSRLRASVSRMKAMPRGGGGGGGGGALAFFLPPKLAGAAGLTRKASASDLGPLPGGGSGSGRRLSEPGGGQE